MKPSTNGIWPLEIAVKKHKFDISLANAIGLEYPRQMSTADLGCGKGEYCKLLSEHYGWPNVVGYEGTVGISELEGSYSRIYFCDLTREIKIVRPFQMVLCLEVGEHVPRAFEQILLDNIANLCQENLIISWAPPGQGGTGHVNERDQTYVLGQFSRRGFEWIKDTTYKLRTASGFKWFRNNIVAMRRIPDANYNKMVENYCGAP